MSYLIFDIETIPDLSVWTPPPVEAPVPDPTAALPGQLTLVQGGTAPAPVNPADGNLVIPPVGTPAKKSRAKKKPADPAAPAKEPFPPLYAHRVVALGWVWLDDSFGVSGMGCVGTRAHGDNEAAILEGWNGFVNQYRPTIVTFAGRGFEIPVLSLRAFRLGITQGWADKDYRHRYGEQHLDLFDLFTEHGLVPRTGFSLDTFAKLIGLPGKQGVDGSSVAGMFARGEIDKLEGYCTSDAVTTTFLLLRYLLMRGRLAKDQYIAAANGLLQTCATQGLGSITFGIDAKRLLLTE